MISTGGFLRHASLPHRILSRIRHRSETVKPGHGKTVAVAMSGGIDSAVAALLLQDQGYNCVGVFMKNWDPADECGSATCDISADVIDMRQVCKRLNIPAYEVTDIHSLFVTAFFALRFVSFHPHLTGSHFHMSSRLIS